MSIDDKIQSRIINIRSMFDKVRSLDKKCREGIQSAKDKLMQHLDSRFNN